MTRWLLVSLGLSLSAASFGASPCSKTYSKVLPFDLPLGTEQASLDIHNELSFSYDCLTLRTRAGSEANVQFLNMDLNVLQSELSATQTREAPGAGYVRLTVAGFELARRDFTLDKVYEQTISPDSDFDFSETQVFNVGPIAVPVNYGIEGNASLEIFAGWKDLGLEAEANPIADAKVYVQGTADLKLVQLLARGDMVLIKDRLSNKARVSFEEDGQLFIRLAATSVNDLEAFDGGVLVRATSSLDGSQKIWERQLFDWDAISRQDQLAEFSDRVLVIP